MSILKSKGLGILINPTAGKLADHVLKFSEQDPEDLREMLQSGPPPPGAEVAFAGAAIALLIRSEEAVFITLGDLLDANLEPLRAVLKEVFA